MEEQLFMPNGILNNCHPRGSEGLFVHKDICTAVSTFIPAVEGGVIGNHVYKWLKSGLTLQTKL